MRSSRAHRGLRALLGALAGSVTLLAGVASAATPVPRAAALPAVHQVAGWVAAGMKLRVVSASIGHQLGADEYAWIPESACLTKAIDASTATPCVLGDTSSTTTVVVYGDSSADQWALDVARLGSTTHFRVVAYVRAACPVGDVVVELAGKHVDPGCATFRQTVLADLAAMRPAPSLVLASELRLSNYETATGSTVTNASWSSGLTTTLDDLEHHGLAVAVLHGVPVTGEDPATCLAAHPRQATRCTTPRGAADPSGYDKATLAGTLAAHAAGVDVVPLFCTASACPDIADGNLTHAGDNHVDETWAKAAGAALGELVGCVTAQRFDNRTAATRVLADLVGATPSAGVLRACRALSP